VGANQASGKTTNVADDLGMFVTPMSGRGAVAGRADATVFRSIKWLGGASGYRAEGGGCSGQDGHENGTGRVSVQEWAAGGLGLVCSSCSLGSRERRSQQAGRVSRWRAAEAGESESLLMGDPSGSVVVGRATGRGSWRRLIVAQISRGFVRRRKI